MNAKRLLQHFDRISEAPDAIPRLRSFILDLAVRGKLVAQNPDAERVADEYLAEPTSNNLPRNWRLLNFGKFCDIQGGNQPPKSQFADEPRPGYLRLFQIRDLGARPVPTYIPAGTTNRFCRVGEILIGRYGASVGKIFWAQDGAYNVALAKFIYPENAFVSQFAFLVLKSDFFQETLVAATRSAQAGFNKGDLAKIDFPLPPLIEQHRIVAKVDELMALCDQLEAAKNEREQSRDRLVAASLHRLNLPGETEKADAFRDHVRFTFQNFSRLTTRPEHIKQLRQTILNLAVRGKLVPQDPNDEPAALFEPNAELRSSKPATRTEKGDSWPYVVSSTWAWRRISNVCDQVTDGEHATPQRVIDRQIPLVTAKNVRDGEMDYTHTDWVSLDTAEKAWRRCRPSVGDILLVCVGATTGRLCVLREARDMVLVRSVALLRPSRGVDVNYLSVALRSPMCQQEIWKQIKATAQPCLYINRINRLPIPLPPHAEQRRIVAKVDELMALCSQLETQLNTAQADSRSLLEATLHEALAPALEESA